MEHEEDTAKTSGGVEEKIKWTEQEVAEYFGNGPLVCEALKDLKDDDIMFFKKSVDEFLHLVKEIKGDDKLCEYRSEGFCNIKMRHCMFRSSKLCPTYRNKGRHFLLSWATQDIGSGSFDLLIAHPYFEPLVNAADRIVSSGHCPRNIAFAFVILHSYLHDMVEEELVELMYLKSKEGTEKGL